MAHHKSSDPNVFILPDLGEGVHEAELKEWKVKPGDYVEEHQTVAEMETDKALVEVPSPRAGVIAELFGNPGDILKVGAPAWTYQADDGKGHSSTAGSAAAAHAAPRSAAPAQTSRSASSAREAQPTTRASDASSQASAEREDAGTVVGTMTGTLGGVGGEGGKALATPAVRRLARDLGVDIDTVKGTGIGGRVTEKDVRAAASSGGAGSAGVQRAAPAAAAPAARRSAPDLATTVPAAVESRPPQIIPITGESTRIPVRGVRRTISLRLRESVDKAVHFSVMDECDVTGVDEVRTRLAAASGEKLSYLPFVASAVCRALKKFPSLNAHVDDEAGELIRYHVTHMGIATDTEAGLAVPVIPNCDALGLLEISRHIAEIARMARDRSIPRERLMGSTFTISNVGSYAGRFATPIINYPEVGILAAGRVREGVIADRGAIRIAKLIPLSLTCDHRSVDGAEAARCLAYIMELLQAPEELLTPARG